MADSKIGAENVQDEPGLWYQKPRKKEMTIAVCEKDSDAKLKGSH